MPKYLIWYLEHEDSKVWNTIKQFSEHTSVKTWRLEINRLKKNPIVTRLKYKEL